MPVVSCLRALAPIIAAAVIAAGLSACGSNGAARDGRVLAVATTTQLADITRELGGSDVDVRQILRPSSDPHEYEPRPRDVQAVADARLVLRSGLGLDDWISSVESSSGTHALVLDVGAVAPLKLAGPGGPDPHWWHDPRNVAAATRTIERALIRADRAHAAAIARRAQAYRSRLGALDRRIVACVQRIPAARRLIVTDHDAFGYLVRRYGIRVVGAVIPSQSTLAQASAGALARLERTIRRDRVLAVFPESSVNRKLAERLASDTGASARYVLYGDTLGPAGSLAGSYIGMEEANAEALVRGMSGGRIGCRIRV